MEEFQRKFSFIERIVPERGDAWFIVPAQNIAEVAMWLRDEKGFDCLSCLTGVDRGDALEVVYHLFSYKRAASSQLPGASKDNSAIVLKVRVAKENAEVPTLSKVWASADWMEREAFDLVGIRFAGHPNLKRIMLPEDWKGHPLRKDYVEEAEYQGMTTTR